MASLGPVALVHAFDQITAAAGFGDLALHRNLLQVRLDLALCEGLAIEHRTSAHRQALRL